MTSSIAKFSLLIIVPLLTLGLCSPAHAVEINQGELTMPEARSLADDDSCQLPDQWWDTAARPERWADLQKDPSLMKTIAHLEACKPANRTCLNTFLSPCFPPDNLELFYQGWLKKTLGAKPIPDISQDGRYVGFSDKTNKMAALLVKEGIEWKLHSFQTGEGSAKPLPPAPKPTPTPTFDVDPSSGDPRDLLKQIQ